MLFQGEESSLRLDIVGYEFPPDGGFTGEDLDWLVLRATWSREDGTVVKDTNSCLLAGELQSMTAGLKVLRAGVRDTYASDFLEDAYFSLSAQAAENGRFGFFVSFYLPNTMDGDDTAEITCLMSQEELQALTDELDGLCRKFPPRTKELS